MFRILLILAFVLVGAQQGVTRGNIDLHKFENTVGETYAVAQEDCCGKDVIADEKPSFCKSDCKAVISVATLKPYKTRLNHSMALLANTSSLGKQVDLRPPIS